MNNLLIWALIDKANSNGMDLKSLADELGVTYSYITQLKSGVRKAKNVGDDFISRASIFLAWPKVKVIITSGKVKVEDFFETEVTDNLSSAIENSLKFILRSSEGAGLSPSILNSAQDVQIFVIRSFEKSTKTILLRKIEDDELKR